MGNALHLKLEKDNITMALNIKLLKAICEEAGTSGFESRIRNLVIKSLKGLADEVSVDPMGNVIALKKGKDSSQRIMSTAHMDEIGFMVKFIDDQGFVRVNPLGGFDPKTLTAQRMIIHGKKDIPAVFGAKPIHVMTPDERGKVMQIDDYYLETGYTAKELKKYIEIGNPITRHQELWEMGDCVNCKSMDNRVSVFILLEALKKMKKPAYDFYAVFTVQEEIGLRGAILAGHKINPAYCINLDTTIAFDTPGAKPEEKITVLGDGTAIKIMDSSVVCDYRMVDFMKQTAKKKKIKYQTEILTRGGTDTGGVQRMAQDGAICGAISIPTRNIHQSVEMCNKDDIQGSIDLLLACVAGLNKYDWTHK